jgi:formate hydrogenlyase subunit 6/NADH:ubiquinone oxidoreductase subunit I
MAIKYLKSDQLPAFLEGLAKNARVVAPFKRDGVVQFEPWETEKPVELDVLLAKQSPKEFIFLQTETYLKFGYRMEEPQETTAGVGEGAEGEAAAAALPRETVNVQPVIEAPAQVIFGLRPCDARGFVQMDNVFGGYGGFYFDPLYNARREAPTLLAVTCRDPRSTCFCRAVGGSPFGQDGVDALFTQVEGGFLVEPLTGKGEEAVMAAGAVFAEATAAQAAEAAEVKEVAVARVDVPFELEGVRDNLRENIEAQRWHDLAMRCISCGTCTYVCPNCYCFSINDEIVETKGERYRVWDNCFNPMYTEETSGHNPRAQKSNRFRNRFSHKFWYYPDKYDSLLCSGCGRCIMHCPTRIDIREVVRVMGSKLPGETPGVDVGAAVEALRKAAAAQAGAEAAPGASEGKEA